MKIRGRCAGAVCGGRWDYQQTNTDQENATRRTEIVQSQSTQTAVAQELGHDILDELTKYIFSLYLTEKACGSDSEHGIMCIWATEQWRCLLLPTRGWTKRSMQMVWFRDLERSM